MNDIQYVREQDIEEYQKFCRSGIERLMRPLSEEIWHYTSADGLIGILQSGTIWSTHISCLNDTQEKKHFTNLLNIAIKKYVRNNTDPDLKDLLVTADEWTSNADFNNQGHFVACFSEVEDDLGQWRGYGGGECGFSIGFKTYEIYKKFENENIPILIPMNYDENTHNLLVHEVINSGRIFFKRGLARKLPNLERWISEFLQKFSWELDIYFTMLKNPKFASEKEWRLATWLTPDQRRHLKFRQRRTLLARHLPIDLTVLVSGVSRLPLTRVYVGPGAAQQVSRLSVMDLLYKYGYEKIPVQMSKVPYRVP